MLHLIICANAYICNLCTATYGIANCPNKARINTALCLLPQ